MAKAYRALETDGVISTEGRRGTFVASAAAGADGRDAAAAYVAAARRQGLTLPEAIRLVEQGWSPTARGATTACLDNRTLTADDIGPPTLWRVDE